MKVKAKNHINYNGKWVTGGDVFEIADNDLETIADYVEILNENKADEFVSEIFANSEDEKPEQPKRGRRKKSED